ncbi:MAG: glycosyltransferase family 8 protein [Streptococcaceae bacterium]|jgi:lipopolysaccharide biosynthesis glycosyltransferase|nr:glycosyltransferase family 8 protein [Streptococcaceae bacterium]
MDDKNEVPIVFSVSDFMAPIFYVSLRSLLINKREKCRIFVLYRHISSQNLEIIKTLEDDFECNIEFFNIKNYLPDSLDIENLKKFAPHITEESFFRLLLPEIFPKEDKIIFLDADIIVKKNIFDILQEVDESKVINACRDLVITQGAEAGTADLDNYFINILKNEKRNYFQAGIFVFNLRVFRKNYSGIKLWDYFKKEKWQFADQDILNFVFSDSINFINPQWNILHDNDGRHIPIIRKLKEKEWSEEYFEARKNPAIIHYAGNQKPWFVPNCDLGIHFWAYARNTVVYEILISILVNGVSHAIVDQTVQYLNIKKRRKLF